MGIHIKHQLNHLLVIVPSTLNPPYMFPHPSMFILLLPVVSQARRARSWCSGARMPIPFSTGTVLEPPNTLQGLGGATTAIVPEQDGV